jgi:uncharacterized protein
MRSRPPLEELRRIYADTKTIAVVGASNDKSKNANKIPAYLKSQGYHIIPVNPRTPEVLGEKTYKSLADIPEPVDVVEVFRPASEAPKIAEEAAEIGAKVLWLQVGIVSPEAGEIAEANDMTFVMDHCMGMMHAKLGLGPGPGH